MDISQAKQQVKDSVMAYMRRDELGALCIPAIAQRPLFLLGAPGIGKTAIMGQVAEELGVGLVSYSMTHHTRQSALGLPFVVHRDYCTGESFDVSEYTMSEIIASIYDYMEDTGLSEGILFLDEINCVSETLYPSMLQFLQFKTFGRHSVPEGWVVVCAGNPPEYNRNVHEFDIVTLDRLRRIEVEPSFKVWKSYMLGERIHPSVLSYLELRPEDFYVVETTPEGKAFVSARSWSDLSVLIMLLEELGLPVDRDVIAQYVQHSEIANRFAAYYELFSKYRSGYRIEEILGGHAPAGIRLRARAAAFDERLAFMGLLLDALENDARSVLATKSLLASVRDELRLASQNTEVGFDVALEEAMRRLNKAARIARTASEQRNLKHTCSLLEELAGRHDYEAASELYRERVSELSADIDAARQRFDAAYAFIDEVFMSGSEVLVFTTEIAARRNLAQFVAQFGSDSYFAHSAALSTTAERDAIFDEIDALDS